MTGIEPLEAEAPPLPKAQACDAVPPRIVGHPPVNDFRGGILIPHPCAANLARHFLIELDPRHRNNGPAWEIGEAMRKSEGRRTTGDGGVVLPVQVVARQIYFVRGQKVMMDSDLARLYGVETFNLNKAVKRNADRFPQDFMFQLTRQEAQSLIFQNGMSKVRGRGGRRTPPYVFTEQGVAMLSGVLNSPRAVQVNIVIMRAFVKVREMLSTHKKVLQKLDDLERKYERHDAQIKAVFDAIRKLIQTPAIPKRHIGFLAKTASIPRV